MVDWGGQGDGYDFIRDEKAGVGRSSGFGNTGPAPRVIGQRPTPLTLLAEPQAIYRQGVCAYMGQEIESNENSTLWRFQPLSTMLGYKSTANMLLLASALQSGRLTWY